MPKIEFMECSAGRAKTVEVNEAVALVDVCDDHYAPVPFSCRSASCATCEIEVLEGMEFLEPPAAAEQDLLEILAAPSNHRLACQAQVKPGGGIIRLRAIN
ncbi:MAG TPA: 2Fe-2S iron-sulfur cluster-binding protein [Polyangiaceae bacterium]|nr:2Fe-2S iron-sulfur cluster-binding protein [Polyangiaceae bacterium]